MPIKSLRRRCSKEPARSQTAPRWRVLQRGGVMSKRLALWPPSTFLCARWGDRAGRLLVLSGLLAQDRCIVTEVAAHFGGKLQSQLDRGRSSRDCGLGSSAIAFPILLTVADQLAVRTLLSACKIVHAKSIRSGSKPLTPPEREYGRPQGGTCRTQNRAC